MEALWLEMLPVKQSYWGRVRYGSTFIFVLFRPSRCAGPQKMQKRRQIFTCNLVILPLVGIGSGLSSATSVI